jgi:hypothetical protein
LNLILKYITIVIYHIYYTTQIHLIRQAMLTKLKKSFHQLEKKSKVQEQFKVLLGLQICM